MALEFSYIEQRAGRHETRDSDLHVRKLV